MGGCLSVWLNAHFTFVSGFVQVDDDVYLIVRFGQFPYLYLLIISVKWLIEGASL